MGNYLHLKVWQIAMELAVAVFTMIQNNPKFRKEWSLSDQMRRSAVSISSNIAEGESMDSDKHGLHFFIMARGSLAELTTQIEIARQCALLPQNESEKIITLCTQVGKMLSGLIKAKRKAIEVRR